MNFFIWTTKWEKFFSNALIDVQKKMTIHHWIINKSLVSVIYHLISEACSSKLCNAYSFMYNVSIDKGVSRTP